MFDTVFVANRGEIACRIVRTVHRLGARAAVGYSDADAAARHVTDADAAVRLGPDSPAESYLHVDRVVEAALRSGAQAVHPGYGFLSERPSLAAAVEDAGMVFVGPTVEHLRVFGSKDATRTVAAEAGVPLLPGSPLLDDVDAAVAHARAIGYPVVLKAVAGGGGIGLHACRDEAALREGFPAVVRQATASFGDGGVFLERYLTEARHVEVQLFGDGRGGVAVLGDRDCSVQRRNQKVLEEAPAPGLDPAARQSLHAAGLALGRATGYRSAGTVELLYQARGEDGAPVLALLEVNPRLQVEHTVTEAVTGIDLVEWMLRLSAGEDDLLDGWPDVLDPSGHAIEARLYAEDPGAGYRPSAGTLTTVRLPAGARVDGWIEEGTVVTTAYDPLLAKVVVHEQDRDTAVRSLGAALDECRVDGVATNLDLLRAVAAAPAFARGGVTTGWLGGVRGHGPTVEVLAAGASTSVQELPGRVGLWGVGIPPSGPMDDRSFRLGNRLLGNPEGTAGIEATATGPSLRFRTAATVCLAGAPAEAELDGVPLPPWTVVEVPAGSTLRIGAIGPPGLRAYLLVRGGIDVEPALGSRATFSLGGIGGYGGRDLQPGDVLRLGDPGPGARPSTGAAVPEGRRPLLTDRWVLEVLEGPHSAPEFLTAEGAAALFAASWEVHHNSSRTGVRLVGPLPQWARRDGGEAGLHPSNIHDTPYAVGAVDLTGDMPIILGPDGPSLGGFVCPATVTSTARWKLGQLRPGDRVRLAPRTLSSRPSAAPAGGVLDRWEADGERPAVCWRRSGDEYLLVEYGPMVLDLALRFRVHALARWLDEHAIPGVVETTPGIRSLQLHVDPRRLPVDEALRVVQSAEHDLPGTDDAAVPSRVVHLPLSWDDPATRLAIARYESTVRDDAPWCPWNIEFIRRVNGLADVEEVRRIVHDASYLVLGLGDVYLGAPVATPLDPRHRLVTTKYNPARTWTPENAVGIGGAYLCVYGMEGPGGYQLVGRTVPVWNRHRRTKSYEQPWLLRHFDRLRFFPVTTEELEEWRRDLPLGRVEIPVEEGELRLADHLAFLAAERASIEEFAARQRRAFAAERARWVASGELERNVAAPVEEPAAAAPLVPDGSLGVEAPLHAAVWQLPVAAGDRVEEGAVVAVLESMKMEMEVRAPVGGTVRAVAVCRGQAVRPGQVLVVVEPGAAAEGRPLPPATVRRDAEPDPVP